MADRLNNIDTDLKRLQKFQTHDALEFQATWCWKTKLWLSIEVELVPETKVLHLKVNALTLLGALCITVHRVPIGLHFL